ncbi:unnamed protein product [Symbiodinium sp. KB8]|nr:unnamed protein product [Symbiodinium sp. KB8]
MSSSTARLGTCTISQELQLRAVPGWPAVPAELSRYLFSNPYGRESSSCKVNLSRTVRRCLTSGSVPATVCITWTAQNKAQARQAETAAKHIKGLHLVILLLLTLQCQLLLVMLCLAQELVASHASISNAHRCQPPNNSFSSLGKLHLGLCTCHLGLCLTSQCTCLTSTCLGLPSPCHCVTAASSPDSNKGSKGGNGPSDEQIDEQDCDHWSQGDRVTYTSTLM